MLNLLFNPFDCNVDEITPGNLIKLRNVAEGWYVEYKSMIVPTKSIAKSLAAFANHYGGWIFYGVEEKADGTHFAKSFPGIDQSDASNLIDNIRNAAKDIVSPSPYFEYKRLDGPCDEIGLPEGMCIILIAVPLGSDAPYIHNDGKVYRRIADSSDPKPETDRFILDNLWQRRQQAREKLSLFLGEEPVLSRDEENVSYVDIFLLPDPLGLSNQRVKLKFDEFVTFFSDPPDPKPPVYITFDNFFTMSDGFVARHIYTNDPFKFNFTWKFYSNGYSVVSVPLSSTPVEEIYPQGWLHKYIKENSFIRLLRRKEYGGCFVIDLNQFYFTLMSILSQNRRLLEISGIRGPYYTKAVLRNVWRRIPFIDTKLFIQFVEKCGIPIIQFETEYAPAGKTFETLVKLDDIEPNSQELNTNIDSEDYSRTLIYDQVGIFLHIFNALGLPKLAIFDDNESEKDENSLLEANKRVLEVNKWRSSIERNS